MPYKSKEEQRIYHKQYRENNKKKLALQKKEWYENNKEERLLQRKEYYENNKEKLKEYQKEYYENNKEKIALKQKEWYVNNKEEVKEYNEKIKTENPLEYKLNQMVHHTKSSDIKYNRYDKECHITYEFLQEQHTKQNNKCGYCLVIMEYTFENKNNPIQITIERLNNDLGHIKSNCIFSCWKCNSYTRNKPLEYKL